MILSLGGFLFRFSLVFDVFAFFDAIPEFNGPDRLVLVAAEVLVGSDTSVSIRFIGGSKSTILVLSGSIKSIDGLEY